MEEDVTVEGDCMTLVSGGKSLFAEINQASHLLPNFSPFLESISDAASADTTIMDCMPEQECGLLTFSPPDIISSSVRMELTANSTEIQEKNVKKLENYENHVEHCPAGEADLSNHSCDCLLDGHVSHGDNLKTECKKVFDFDQADNMTYFGINCVHGDSLDSKLHLDICNETGLDSNKVLCGTDYKTSTLITETDCVFMIEDNFISETSGLCNQISVHTVSPATSQNCLTGNENQPSECSINVDKENNCTAFGKVVNLSYENFFNIDSLAQNHDTKSLENNDISPACEGTNFSGLLNSEVNQKDGNSGVGLLAELPAVVHGVDFGLEEKVDKRFGRSQESLVSDNSSEVMEDDLSSTKESQIAFNYDYYDVVHADDCDSLTGYNKRTTASSLPPLFGMNGQSKTDYPKSAICTNNRPGSLQEEEKEKKMLKINSNDVDGQINSVTRRKENGMMLASSSMALPSRNLSSSCSSSLSNDVPQNVVLSAPLSSNINLVITQLGKVAPAWLPDSEAPRCMQCETPFSFTKRRHHCRACGKVYCSNCSNLKAALQYLENKESRVCSKCYQDLIRAQYYQRTHRKANMRPNPNNPSEYCSVVPPHLQVQLSNQLPLPSVMVPTGGVLRKQGSVRSHVEAKKVMFSDGIRPGGDLSEADGFSDLHSVQFHVGRRTRRVEKSSSASSLPSSVELLSKSSVEPKSNTCLIPPFGLPPVVTSSASLSSLSSMSLVREYSLLDSPTMEFVIHQLCNSDHPKPVTFVIDQYLAVIISITEMKCCMHRTCWSFVTKGMRSVGQDELVILIECLPDEKTLPVDIFHHLHQIYRKASQGNAVIHMGHTVLPPGTFGSLDHGGFLFVHPTFQCLENLILPEPPYLFGILLQKWEMSWAKVFPLRLMFRLGAEFRYYPCPLIGVRNRKPVYGEIGHTIMNLLADFHNYQYMVSQISGLSILLEERRMSIRIPFSKYDAVMKVLNSANDHVLALGADLSQNASSHLVCIQNEDGNYQTQAINIQNKPCKATGASFVVFNGALKPTSGWSAKSSIIEDGIMVQVTPATMTSMKQSWKEMKNFTINCCSNLKSDDYLVTIEWIDADEFLNTNAGIESPIDGMSMQGIDSKRIHSGTDYTLEGYIVRWTEVFLIQNRTSELTNLSRLMDSVAQASCLALVPHAALLTRDMMTKIGLRVTIDGKVKLKAGSKGQLLPDFCLHDLDEKLMPLLQKYSAPSLLSSSPPTPSSSSLLSAELNGTIVIELILRILHLSSTICVTPTVSLPD